jgi:hypothetical protein
VLTPRKYAVVRLDGTNTCGIRTRTGDGQVYVQSQRSSEWVGEWQEDTSVMYCNDLETAEALVARLHQTYPKNSYCIMQTLVVSYLPPTPPVRARFTEQGLLPE